MVDVVTRDLLDKVRFTFCVLSPNIRYVNSEGEFVDADSGEVTAEAQVDEAAVMESRGGREVVEG